jgi:predicted transcriptional regulator
MSSRRSRFEIYIDVLSEIKNGSNKPTQVMYGANLSWRPLQEILRSLLNQGLISEIGEDIRDKRTKVQFQLTPKGENVVRYYAKAKSLVEIQGPEESDRPL